MYVQRRKSKHIMAHIYLVKGKPSTNIKVKGKDCTQPFLFVCLFARMHASAWHFIVLLSTSDHLMVHRELRIPIKEQSF